MQTFSSANATLKIISMPYNSQENSDLIYQGGQFGLAKI